MLEKTLADYASRPHTTPLQFGDLRVPQVVAQYKTYRVGIETASPEELAIEFYLLNGASAMLSQQTAKNAPLTSVQTKVLDHYYDTMQSVGHRAFFYLLLICTRETRHCGTTESLKKVCDPLGAVNFWKSIKGLESEEAVQKFLDYPPDVTMKAYTEHMVQCFIHGAHKNGYAGPAWTAVAKPLRDFVHGIITLEVLLDTVWTLAHNNGPIFNKGMLFSNYTSDLQKILDVQRAGQMASLVEFKQSSNVRPYHLNLLALCQHALPDFGGEMINWQKVKELGAKTDWAPKTKPKGILDVHKPKLETVLDSHPDIPHHLMQITPTEFVMKITRKEAKK